MHNTFSKGEDRNCDELDLFYVMYMGFEDCSTSVTKKHLVDQNVNNLIVEIPILNKPGATKMNLKINIDLIISRPPS